MLLVLFVSSGLPFFDLGDCIVCVARVGRDDQVALVDGGDIVDIVVVAGVDFVAPVALIACGAMVAMVARADCVELIDC